jgi:phosphoglycolate phosphatase
MTDDKPITISCQNLIFPDIQAIIFDKDGTLENSRDYWYRVGMIRIEVIERQFPGIKRYLLEILGIKDGKIEPTGLMAVGSRQENEIAMAAGIAATGKSWFDSRQIAHRAIQKAATLTKTAQSCPLYPNTQNFLQQLSQAGLKLAIVSADSTRGVEEFITRHQLKNYISVAIGCDQGISKPDPRLLIEACQLLTVKTQNSLVIGDSQTDIEMGKAAAVAATIGISWESNSIGHLIDADLNITNWSEIQIL